MSTAKTFSPYANERRAFFVYCPTPGKVSKSGYILSKPFSARIFDDS